MYRNGTQQAIILLLLITCFTAIGNEAPQKTTINNLDETVLSLQKKGHFPGGAVAVLHHGKPVHVNTFGHADIGNNVPVTRETVFELASLTKQVTALAIMTLVSEGRLTLDASITDYIEEPPKAWKNITIDQLLSHQAGLAHRFERTVDGVFLLDYSRADMLDSAKSTPMFAEPGSDWNYSDQGYFLLGLVVEKVTQQTFSQYLQSAFFKPLGMKQTHLLDQRKVVPFLATGYALNQGKIERNRRVWQFALTSHFGVMSSLNDMIRWEAELPNPRVIKREALEATWKIQRVFDTGSSCDTWGYARGWQAHVVKEHLILAHGGYSGTAYLRAVDHGYSVIVLTNREDTPDAISPFAIAWASLNTVVPSISADGLQCWQ